MNIHSHSTKVFQIELFTKETGHPMGTGTGFFCSYKDKIYVITNYHVLSGLNPFTGEILHPSGAVPGKIEFDFDIIRDLPNDRKQHIPHRYSINLYNAEDERLWLEHPQFGNNCDVVAFELNEELKSQIPEGCRIGSIEIEKELEYGATIGIMDSVFITGFPMMKSQTYSKFPIYKAGKIASELQDVQNGANYYVDSKTKPGMSGSPIIQKEEPELVKNGNQYQFRKDKINFIGIYSGRAEIRKDEYQAELGIVWPYKEYLIPILEENTTTNNA